MDESAVYKGQVWCVVWGGAIIRMEVLGFDRDFATLGEVPWPRAIGAVDASTSPSAVVAGAPRRVLRTTLAGLLLSAVIDDRRGGT